VEYKIRILKCGTTAAPGPEVYYLSDFEKWYPLNCYLYLITGGKKSIVVDTGCRDVNEFNAIIVPSYGPQGEKAKFVVKPEEEPRALLLKAGVNPNDVDILILTHLHYDHVSNVALFPNADVYISRRGWTSVMAPRHRQLAPAILFPRDVYAYLFDKKWDRVHLVEDEKILPDIKVFWIGGHTQCSQAVAVNTKKGTVIITGDTVFTYKNIEENIPVGLSYSLLDCLDAMQRIREEAAIVLPGHDPETLRRFPSAKIP
jgi:glyoxylase-like metal-dependent hydrolase (beta-lactamase superfamily II)